MLIHVEHRTDVSDLVCLGFSGETCSFVEECRSEFRSKLSSTTLDLLNLFPRLDSLSASDSRAKLGLDGRLTEKDVARAKKTKQGREAAVLRGPCVRTLTTASMEGAVSDHRQEICDHIGSQRSFLSFSASAASRSSSQRRDFHGGACQSNVINGIS